MEQAESTISENLKSSTTRESVLFKEPLLLIQ